MDDEIDHNQAVHVRVFMGEVALQKSLKGGDMCFDSTIILKSCLHLLFFPTLPTLALYLLETLGKTLHSGEKLKMCVDIAKCNHVFTVIVFQELINSIRMFCHQNQYFNSD